MSTTPTDNYDFGKPTVGGSLNTWGEEFNQSLDDIDTKLYEFEQTTTNDNLRINNNYFINPCFVVCQDSGASLAALSFASIPTAHPADLWDSGGLDMSIARTQFNRVSDLIGQTGYNNASPYGGKFTVTGILDPLSTTSIAYIRTSWEGMNAQFFTNQDQITISFWVKSNRIGTYTILYQNTQGAQGYYADKFNVMAIDEWEKKTFSFQPYSSITSQVPVSTLFKAHFRIVLAAGNVTSTVAQWRPNTTTSLAGYTTQVNLFATTTNEITFTQFKLEVGSTATQFIGRSLSDELKLCERYFQKSNAMDFNANAATTTGCVYGTSRGDTSTGLAINVRYKTRMMPFAGAGGINVDVYNPVTAGGLEIIRNITNATDVSASSNYGSESGFVIIGQEAAGSNSDDYAAMWKTVITIE